MMRWLFEAIRAREKRQFDAQVGTMGQVNADTLRAILRKNRDTDFGRRHRFASLQSVADYQRALPVSTYEAYRPHVDRIARGEHRVLGADKVRYLAVSSGTTGTRKLVPLSHAYFGRMNRAASIGQAILAEKMPASRSGRTLLLMNGVLSERSEAGLPMGALSTIGAHSLKRLAAPLGLSSPGEVFGLRTQADGLYVHLLFGLRERNVRVVAAVFSSGLLDMVHLLERRWPDLVDDIGRGELRAELGLTAEQRHRLGAMLRPDSRRAGELTQVLSQGMQSVIRRIWPRIAYASAITGGSFGLYLRQLASAFEGIPIYPAAYASNECAVGLALDVGPAHYCLLPGSAFFEFIPEEEMDASVPRTLLPEALVEGARYEVVVTTEVGLCRYRMEDVVRIVGRHRRAPVMEFLYRRGALLNMAGEKTSEHAARHALDEALASAELRAVDYTTVEDSEALPGRYIFFVEVSQPAAAAALPSLSRSLEESLHRANPFYQATRGLERLGPAILQPVQTGTFAALREVLVQRGVSPHQAKVPRVVRDPELQRLLQDRVVGQRV